MGFMVLSVNGLTKLFVIYSVNPFAGNAPYCGMYSTMPEVFLISGRLPDSMRHLFRINGLECSITFVMCTSGLGVNVTMTMMMITMMKVSHGLIVGTKTSQSYKKLS
jgi:hypothetical protein